MKVKFFLSGEEVKSFLNMQNQVLGEGIYFEMDVVFPVGDGCGPLMTIWSKGFI